MKGTSAAKAGIKDDDIILSMNGTPVCNDEEHIMSSFKKMIEQQKIGSLVALDILRNGQKLSLTAALEELPTHIQGEAKHPDIGACQEQSSMLDNALRAHNALSAYNTILDDLYKRSNMVHNPGSAYEKNSHPLQLSDVTYLLRHPLAAGEVAKKSSQRVTAPLEEMHWQMGPLLQRAAALLDIELAPSERTAEISFPALLLALEEAKKRLEEAFGNLTPKERALLQSKALNPMDDAAWNEVLDISTKVDRAKLLNAFTPLFSFFDPRQPIALKRRPYQTVWRQTGAHTL